MYKALFLATAAAAIGLAVLPMSVATAAPAATHGVLTTSKVGGPNVRVGDVLVASLAKGTNATFFTPGTKNGITCRTSSFTVKVVKNPNAPGTAIESLTKQTFGKCTSAGFSEVLGVNSVTVLKTPYKTTVSDSKGNPATVFKASTKLNLKGTVGNIICVYGAAKVSGSASNTGQVLTFTNQSFTKVSGPSVCPRSGGLTAKFGPVVDTSVKSKPHVYIN